MTIYNQDGSLSASCGNGTRCVAHYLAERSGAHGDSARDLRRPAGGAARGAVVLYGRHGSAAPRLARHSARAREVADTARGRTRKFRPAAGLLRQHGQSARDLLRRRRSRPIDLAAIGPVLEHDPLFPQRANISLAQVLSRDDVSRLKVWERGTGLTLACGTAACATLRRRRARRPDRSGARKSPAGRRSGHRMARSRRSRRDDRAGGAGVFRASSTRRFSLRSAGAGMS